MAKRKKSRVAELGREEHEDREAARHRLKRLRGHKKAHPMPRSIRDRRTAGKHGDERVL
jgi:hypothetical protein